MVPGAQAPDLVSTQPWQSIYIINETGRGWWTDVPAVDSQLPQRLLHLQIKQNNEIAERPKPFESFCLPRIPVVAGCKAVPPKPILAHLFQPDPDGIRTMSWIGFVDILQIGTENPDSWISIPKSIFIPGGYRLCSQILSQLRHQSVLTRN